MSSSVEVTRTASTVALVVTSPPRVTVSAALSRMVPRSAFEQGVVVHGQGPGLVAFEIGHPPECVRCRWR